MRALAGVLSCLVLAGLAACGGGGGGISCSLKDPAEIDEGVGQWAKFRRDRQNTGTVLLEADAYQALARMRPTPPTTPDAGASPTPTPLAFPGLEEGESTVGPFVASPVVHAIDANDPSRQRIYIGSTNGIFYGLDENLHRLLTTPSATANADETPTPTPSTFELNANPYPFSSAALVATREDREVIFVGGGNALVFGVGDDGISQKDVWPSTTDGSVVGSITIGVDGTIFAPNFGNRFLAICPNGVARFFSASGASESSPAVGFDPDEDLNGTVYFGADDRRVRAVTKDGLPRWSVTLSAPILAGPVVQLDSTGKSTGAPPGDISTVTTEAIYVVDSAAAFVKIDINGRKICDLDAPTVANPVVSSPALARFLPPAYCPASAEPACQPLPGSDSRCDRLYAVFDSQVWAINPTSGRKVWSFDVGARVRTSPAVALAHDADAAGGEVDPTRPPIVVVGADDGRVYYVRDDGDSASLIGTFALPQTDAARRPILSSPAIAADGTVYVGGQDGRLYAIK